MGVCWYCHWGWAKPVADIYLEAVRRLDGNDIPLLYGPSHIVWEDENFDCAETCLRDFFDFPHIENYTAEELAKLPWVVWDIEPEDYDDLHPELFPPKVETVKV